MRELVAPSRGAEVVVPLEYAGRIAELTTIERGLSGYMLLLPRPAASEPCRTTHVELDFIFGETLPSGWTPSKRSDFVAPAPPLLDHTSAGSLSFNGIDYQLRWLTQSESDRIVEEYSLHTWA